MKGKLTLVERIGKSTGRLISSTSPFVGSAMIGLTDELEIPIEDIKRAITIFTPWVANLLVLYKVRAIRTRNSSITKQVYAYISDMQETSDLYNNPTKYIAKRLGKLALQTTLGYTTGRLVGKYLKG